MAKDIQMEHSKRLGRTFPKDIVGILEDMDESSLIQTFRFEKVFSKGGNNTKTQIRENVSGGYNYKILYCTKKNKKTGYSILVKIEPGYYSELEEYISRF
tara:strand:+ start:923 stop:1222 length:300 start_codon:yes stop_codon:yes gene_type:complete